MIPPTSDTDALGRFVLFPSAVEERLSQLHETDERVGARQLLVRLIRLGNILGEPVQVAADGCKLNSNEKLF
jgi:hypothetical protein